MPPDVGMIGTVKSHSSEHPKLLKEARLPQPFDLVFLWFVEKSPALTWYMRAGDIELSVDDEGKPMVVCARNVGLFVQGDSSG